MTARTCLRLALVLLSACVLANPAWAQHASGFHGGGGFSSHAGGSFGSHVGGGFGSHVSPGPGFGSRSAFRPSLPAPRSFYGPRSPYRGPFASPSFRRPSGFGPPSTGFQHFRSFSGSSARPAARPGTVPRSAYLGARNPRYSSYPQSRAPSATPWRAFSGRPNSRLSAASRVPLAPMHYGHFPVPGHPAVLPPQSGFFTVTFVNNFFFGPRPFFFSPFFFPSPFFSPFFFSPFAWSWFYPPPLVFSDSLGCPYDDYYYQRQRYYQPAEETAQQAGTSETPAAPSESTGEAANPPAEQPQEQAAPFAYETPLPDVIEWGKASETAPQTPSAPPGKGPLVVGLPHHTLTILPNNPNPPAVPAP